MKEKARKTLENIIKELDKETQSSQNGFWKAQSGKEIKSDDEDTLRRTYFNIPPPSLRTKPLNMGRDFCL